jgi:hypothetical protein
VRFKIRSGTSSGAPPAASNSPNDPAALTFQKSANAARREESRSKTFNIRMSGKVSSERMYRSATNPVPMIDRLGIGGGVYRGLPEVLSTKVQIARGRLISQLRTVDLRYNFTPHRCNVQTRTRIRHSPAAAAARSLLFFQQRLIPRKRDRAHTVVTIGRAIITYPWGV